MEQQLTPDGIRRLLVVDDEEPMAGLIASSLKERGHTVSLVDSSEAAISLLDKIPHHVLITDLKMHGSNGFDLLKQVKQRDPALPVIILTSSSEVDRAVKAVRQGAENFLLKPFDFEQLDVSVAKALEKRDLIIENRRARECFDLSIEEKTNRLRYALNRVQGTFNATVEAMVSAIEARDCETQHHCRRAREYTLLLARALGFEGRDLRHLAWGALLHDVGKIGVPDHILLKKGPLTAREWELMRKHPMIGYRLLGPIQFLREAAQIVLHHHEKWDGTGYPYGKQGEEIPFGARIFMVADAFETITSKRSYKEAFSFEHAEEEIIASAGTHFDPQVVEAFRRIGKDEWLRIRNKYLAEILQGPELYKQREATVF